MESDPNIGKNRRRKSRLIVICGCALVILLVVVVVLAVVLSRTDPFKAEFMNKCETWTADEKSPDCVKVWNAFEQAYVGRNPWQVQTEAYDDLMSIAPPQPACDRMLFWSGTKELAHQVSKYCYRTVEDSMLGSLLDNKKWCGKERSSHTYTTGCPEWNNCMDTPVKSLWRRISAESMLDIKEQVWVREHLGKQCLQFAKVACGNIFVLLNGSKEPLVRPDSIFATIEIKEFTRERVKSLTVVPVSDNVVSKCEHESIKNLQKKLQPGITFNCKEVTESELLACTMDPDRPCGACL